MSFLRCAESFGVQGFSGPGKNIFPQDYTEECGFANENRVSGPKLTPVLSSCMPG